MPKPLETHLITQLLNENDIVGIVCAILHTDGSMEIGMSEELSYLERLGMGQAIVADAQYVALHLEEEE